MNIATDLPFKHTYYRRLISHNYTQERLRNYIIDYININGAEERRPRKQA